MTIKTTTTNDHYAEEEEEVEDLYTYLVLRFFFREARPLPLASTELIVEEPPTGVVARAAFPSFDVCGRIVHARNLSPCASQCMPYAYHNVLLQLNDYGKLTDVKAP